MNDIRSLIAGVLADKDHAMEDEAIINPLRCCMYRLMTSHQVRENKRIQENKLDVRMRWVDKDNEFLCGLVDNVISLHRNDLILMTPKQRESWGKVNAFLLFDVCEFSLGWKAISKYWVICSYETLYDVVFQPEKPTVNWRGKETVVVDGPIDNRATAYGSMERFECSGQTAYREEHWND